MQMARYFLGVDNGGTATKAVLFDETGREIASASKATPVVVEQEVRQQRDMEELWRITAATIGETVATSGVAPEEIACVGCTGHGKGLYLWGKDNRPAYWGIASTDRRATMISRKWQEDGTSAEAAKRSLQNVLACQPAALLAWLKEEDRTVYENVQWVLEAKDYIRFRLTGEAFAEATDYSGTSLMNLQSQSFDPELFRLFGIEEMTDCMPPLCYSTSLCGHITKEAASLTGLAEGTPVCGGMFDIDSCAIAMDVSTPDRLCVITGTWSINEYVATEPIPVGTTTQNSLFCIPGLYLIEESSATSAGNLEWYIQQICRPEGEDKKDFYRKLNESVDSLPPEDSNVFFLPFLYGSNVEGCDKAAFLGLHSGCQLADLHRAIYEGVVYCHKMHIERLLKHRTAPVAIRLAGGAAKSSVWVQMFADVIGLPVEVVANEELGALGCAMAGAVCCGAYSDYPEAAKAMVHIKETVFPNPARTEIYQKKYEQYKRYTEGLSKC